jgi:ribosome assembly protein YihI (activator of Der GTPase)
MKKSDEEHCLNMIMNPQFVQNLKILQQGSGSTIGTSFKGDSTAMSHQDPKIHSQENVPLTLD